MQLDQIGYFIKNHCQPLYRLAEAGIGHCLFFRYRSQILGALRGARVDGIVNGEPSVMRPLAVADLDALEHFFSRLEAESEYLRFFRPHGFSRAELRSILRKPYFLLYGLFIGDEIVGYGLLKLFLGRKAFRGRLVAKSWGGKGLGRYISQYMNWQCAELRFRARSTISRKNLASLKSHEVEGHYTVLGELPNDYILIEFKEIRHESAPELNIV